MGFKHKYNADNMIAIVTGTSGNIGPIWIEALLQVGAKVFTIDRVDAQKKEEYQCLLQKYGGEFLAFQQSDILVRDSLEAALDRCVELFGHPTVLVNNAGIDQPPEKGVSYKLEDIPMELFMPTLNVNVYGSFLCSQVFGASMVQQGNGSIINIGSLYATVSPNEAMYAHIESSPPFIKPPAYGASKSALYNLTRYMSAHWGKHNVRVNMLSPGGVRGKQDEEFKIKFCEHVPMQRMAVKDDLIGPLLFLASDASAYVTGINLQVDGGFTVW